MSMPKYEYAVYIQYMQVFEMKMRNILIGCMLGDPEGRAPESS
jgi:hypothetical protein